MRVNTRYINSTWNASKYKVHKLHQRYILERTLVEGNGQKE